jgi:hypothetical protein
MKQTIVYFAIITALVGILVIDHGVTGFAVSQSCCFGPTCPADSVCAVAQPVTATDSDFFVRMGVLLLAVAVSALVSAKMYSL